MTTYTNMTGYWEDGQFWLPVYEVSLDGPKSTDWKLNATTVGHWDRQEVLQDASAHGLEQAAMRHPIIIRRT